jgi:hypothetical protein
MVITRMLKPTVCHNLTELCILNSLENLLYVNNVILIGTFRSNKDYLSQEVCWIIHMSICSADTSTNSKCYHIIFLLGQILYKNIEAPHHTIHIGWYIYRIALKFNTTDKLILWIS